MDFEAWSTENGVRSFETYHGVWSTENGRLGMEYGLWHMEY